MLLLFGGGAVLEALVAAARAEGEHEVGERAEHGAEDERHGHRRHQRDEVEPVSQLLPHGARHEARLRKYLQHTPRKSKNGGKCRN